jgi:processive rubber oxygenase RoxA-like protein
MNMDSGILPAWLKRRLLSPVRSIARGLGSTWWGMAPPVLLLVGMMYLVTQHPEKLAEALTVDLFRLPSEDAVPKSIPTRDIDESDPVWRFRYLETGTEFRAGIPYWIFRVMPKIFREEFQGQGYDRFGFTDDDQRYYRSRPVPRGMSLSDTSLRSQLLQIQFSLKRVSINCSGCHQAEYLNAKNERVLQPGMPNHTADLQGFKRFFGTAFQNPKFEANRVISEIDAALADEGHPPLIWRERLIYTGLVQAMKRLTQVTPGAWMNSRPDNGPGRIDPFNAVKFEVLGAADDHTAATLDFPSVWNQRVQIRPWHHWDGNTSDSSARNFGSVIGVGGIPTSVNQEIVSKTGDWLDEFPPPKYPFGPPEPAAVGRGMAVFEQTCAMCHGVFDRSKNDLVDREKWPLYMQVDLHVGTDPERWKAFLPSTSDALNLFGFNHNLWPRNAFRGSADPGGYLRGPLDGIWARAPYLHNGSVPNIAELLKPPGERVKTFYRGNRHYDEAQLGFVSDQATEGGRTLFKYDTSLIGNWNVGHDYGTTLDAARRDDLIAYLKTL